MHLSQLNAATLKRLPEGVHWCDDDVMIQGKAVPRGFGIKVTDNGARSFFLNYRDANRRERRYTIGRWPDWDIPKAVQRGRELRQAIDRGEDPLSQRRVDAGALTVSDVLDAFLKHRVRDRLRTEKEFERIFDKYVRPEIGREPVATLKRSDITAMLDGVATTNGLVMADKVLARLRAALNWHATRVDDFIPPIVKGMNRTSIAERARDRILSDNEIRALWAALDAPRRDPASGWELWPACYPAFVRVLLMTGQRRSEVAGMRWDEIEGDPTRPGDDCTWIIGRERYKTNVGHVVPLSEPVKAFLGPRGKGYVFTSDGGETGFSGFSKARKARTCWAKAMCFAFQRTRSRIAWTRQPFHHIGHGSGPLISRTRA